MSFRLLALCLVLCSLFSALSAQATTAQAPLMIKLTWDNQYNGQAVDIAAWVNGILDDGSEIIRAQTEGEYLSSMDYSHVGSHYNYGTGLTELSFYRLDSDISITIEWANEELLFSGLGYADVNLNIEVSTPEGILMNIAANAEAAAAHGRENLVPMDDFYCRGGTGVWYLGLRIDHGNILPLNGIAVEPQEETPYIQDVQSQSVEAYNEYGYKTASEWYENGALTAYTYWDYDESGNLLQIRYMNMLEPDEVKILFSYENDAVQMYNIAGTLLAEGTSAYDAAEMLGMGSFVSESMNASN